VLSTLKSLQSEVKSGEKRFKDFKKTLSNKGPPAGNLTKIRVDELASNKSIFKKRKADELSEVSDNAYESVCPVFLATGKCERKGCNLEHLDGSKKKEFLANWSTINSGN
jgi:hypothetical protein